MNMNCKYCNAELDEDISVCPVCGKVQTEVENVASEMAEEAAVETDAVEVPAEEVEVPEAEEEELKPGKSKSARVATSVVAIVLLLAILIGETRRGKGFFRMVAYLPNMLPGLAVVILWSSFFSGGSTGVLNILLSAFDIPPQTYLTRAEWVIPIIMIATWKGAGATALIYMASIAGISPELYEAATIDGASLWQRILHIMLPAIRKLTGTLLILQIISVFQIMYEPMVLTKGGPDNASLSLMQLMWQYAFGGAMNYGRASAVAVIVTIILLIMTAIYSYFNRKESDWD